MPKALNFTATTVDGKPFDAKTLAGKPPCVVLGTVVLPRARARPPRPPRSPPTTRASVNVVGVAVLDKNAAMRDFVSDTGTGSFPHLSDEKGEVWKRFEVTQQSHYVILDKTGKTRSTIGVLPGGKGLADKVAGLTG